MDNKKIESVDEKFTLPPDLLNRKEFIDRTLTIIEKLSDQKKNVCFSISGNWGIGKTFVLEHIEHQLLMETANTEKYAVFHYNCWQYDYYEEPLVAIIAVMLDAIKENENLLSEKASATIRGFLKIIGNGLLIKASSFVEEKTGINVEEIWKFLQEGNQETAKEIANNHAYDINFLFRQVLNRFRETVVSMAQGKTIIFVVDELDRCLPEYSIKVLERLHHIFDEINNVQVILSIDKHQLAHTVKQIYGVNTNVERYLSKFINFSLILDTGEFNEEFDTKFGYYINNFEYSNSATKQYDVENFKCKIFDGINMRSRIRIIDKCQLIHHIIYDENQKCDFSFMCIELLLAILSHEKIYCTTQTYRDNNIFGFKDELHPYIGLGYFNSICNGQDKQDYLYHAYSEGSHYVNLDDIWGASLAAYRYVIGFEKDEFGYRDYSPKEIIKHASSFWNLLQIIE